MHEIRMTKEKGNVATDDRRVARQDDRTRSVPGAFLATHAVPHAILLCLGSLRLCRETDKLPP